jgi:hypothetical protein
MKRILLIIVFISTQLFSQNFWQKTSFPSGGQINSVYSLLGIGGNQILAGTFGLGIYKSTDNGNNWNPSGLSSQWIIDLKLDNQGNIYALSVGSAFGTGVFKSTDNGNNWTQVWSYIGGLNCLYIDPNNNIYVGLNFFDGQGGVYKSSNGGSTWNKIFNFPANVYAIVKSSNGTLLCAAYENGLAHIFRTTNEGTSWTKYSFTINFTATDFAINPQGAIYLSTAGYGIYYSTDNGNSWNNIAPVGPDFSCLFIDGNTVYAGTRGNWVYRATDGTSNWHLVNTGMNQDNYVLSLVSSNRYLFAGMDYTGIYRSINQVVSVEEEDILNDNFILYQNYPNPFNSQTVIRYSIPTSPYFKGRIEVGFATLKVYDILGNEIATLVDEYKEAGTHKIDFPSVETKQASSLPSGVYFYQLKIGNQIKTMKMILLR